MASSPLPSPARLEAFSDGVIAIIVTIMVLELKVPHSPEPEALLHSWPIFLAYALSFATVGVYWVNHHHLFAIVERVDDGILWANLLLLFFLSLIPFATGYMSENGFAPFPTAVYGASFLFPALCYLALIAAIRNRHDSTDQHAHLFGPGAQRKNIISLLAYVVAIPLAFVSSSITILIGIAVALYWTVPNFWRHKPPVSDTTRT
jgi:uncharacterized membrane protein